jgi:hypothetical protein
MIYLFVLGEARQGHVQSQMATGELHSCLSPRASFASRTRQVPFFQPFASAPLGHKQRKLEIPGNPPKPFRDTSLTPMYQSPVMWNICLLCEAPSDIQDN